MVTATCLIGFIMYDNSRKKVAVCRELIAFCDCLRRDFMYKATPIGELVSDIVSSSELKEIKFINSDSITECKTVVSPLSADADRELNSFLHSLGRSDVQTQLDLIAGFRDYLIELENKYRNNHIKNSRIYLSFGLFSGVTVALVLI